MFISIPKRSEKYLYFGLLNKFKNVYFHLKKKTLEHYNDRSDKKLLSIIISILKTSLRKIFKMLIRFEVMIYLILTLKKNHKCIQL